MISYYLIIVLHNDLILGCFEEHVEYYGQDSKAQSFVISALQCQLNCQMDSDCSFFSYFPSLLLCIQKKYVTEVLKKYAFQDQNESLP